MQAIQWFLLGVLFTLTVFGIAYASIVIKARWYAWAALIVGMFLVMFGIAWAGSSFHEGIPASGAMGLTLFAFPGVIIITLGWRYWVAPGLKTE